MTELWKKQLDEIGDAVTTYKSYAPIMTQLERTQAQKRISRLFNENGKLIIDHVLGEWDQALTHVRGAFQGVKEAKRAETRKWDAGKLNAEMQAIETQIRSTVSGQPEPEAVEQLKQLYGDLADCGDPYKQRAAAEIFRTVTGRLKTEDGRRLGNRLRNQAARDLEKTRKDDPNLQAAHKVAAAAVDHLNAVRRMIAETDRKLDQTRPNGEIGNYEFFKALHRVETTNSGEIKAIDGEDV